MRRLLLLIIIYTALWGCGQKGPLFLPEPEDEQRMPEPPIVLDTDDPEFDDEVDETEDEP